MSVYLLGKISKGIAVLLQPDLEAKEHTKISTYTCLCFPYTVNEDSTRLHKNYTCKKYEEDSITVLVTIVSTLSTFLDLVTHFVTSPEIFKFTLDS